MPPKYVNFLILMALSASMTACISDVEKQARTDNAYDVSGDYTASKASGSEANLSIQVRNKSSRSDISAVVTRDNPQEPKETSFLQQNGIDPTAVSNHFGTRLVLDNGDSNNFFGGTNHSEDFGASDTFALCTESYHADSTHSLQYCLSGNVKKADWVLRGGLKLLLTTETKQKDKDGKDVSSLSLNEVELSYNAAMPTSFFNQYYGTWTGAVNQRFFGPSNDLKGDEVLTISQSGDGFLVQPAKSTIVVNGVTYSYVSRAQSLAQTKDMNIPLIEVLYQGPNEDRVVLFCQIYSLGKMTGSAVLIRGNDQTQFASFALIHR